MKKNQKLILLAIGSVLIGIFIFWLFVSSTNYFSSLNRFNDVVTGKGVCLINPCTVYPFLQSFPWSLVSFSELVFFGAVIGLVIYHLTKPLLLRKKKKR